MGKATISGNKGRFRVIGVDASGKRVDQVVRSAMKAQRLVRQVSETGGNVTFHQV